MNWTLEQVLAFVSAAEEGSFSAAARALGRAQSVVSTHIATLEDALGVELFDRSSRSPRLSEAGQDLLPEARAVLRQSYRLEARALARVRGEAPKLDIAICHGVPFKAIAESVAELVRRHPHMSGSFHADSLDKVWSDVREGKAHIGLVLGLRPPDSGPCEMVCLGHIHYSIVAARGFPLLDLPEVSLLDLARYRQILTSTEDRRWIFSAQYWLVDNVLGAMYLAALGLGWTIAPTPLVRRQLMNNTAMRNLERLRPECHRLPLLSLNLIWNPVSFTRRDVVDLLCHEIRRRTELDNSEEEDAF